MNDAPLLVGRLEKVITSQQLVDLVSHIFTLRAFLIRSWISAITSGARGPGPGGASSVRLRCRRKSVEPPRSGSRMRQRAAGQNRVKVGPRTRPSVFRCSLKKAPVATRSALSAAAATARVEPTLSLQRPCDLCDSTAISRTVLCWLCRVSTSKWQIYKFWAEMWGFGGNTVNWEKGRPPYNSKIYITSLNTNNE